MKFISAFAPLVLWPCLVLSAEPQAMEFKCGLIQAHDRNVVTDLKGIETSITRIEEGWGQVFSLSDPKNECATNLQDVFYILGFENENITYVLAMIEGFTPHMEIREVEGQKLLFAKYSKGAHGSELSVYRFFGFNNIALLPGYPVFSNYFDLRIEGNSVFTMSRERDNNGKTFYFEHRYEVHADRIEYIDKKIINVVSK